MKKHVLLSAALCMTAVMATACGSKHTQTQENAAETTTEAADAETKAADTTKPDLSNVDPRIMFSRVRYKCARISFTCRPHFYIYLIRRYTPRLSFL